MIFAISAYYDSQSFCENNNYLDFCKEFSRQSRCQEKHVFIEATCFAQSGIPSASDDVAIATDRLELPEKAVLKGPDWTTLLHSATSKGRYDNYTARSVALLNYM